MKRFINADDADGIILRIHIHDFLCIIGQQALFGISADDAAHYIQNLQTEGCFFGESGKVLFFCGGFIGDAGEVDSIDFDAADLKRRTADRIKIKSPYVSIRLGLSLIQRFSCISPFPIACQ